MFAGVILAQFNRDTGGADRMRDWRRDDGNTAQSRGRLGKSEFLTSAIIAAAIMRVSAIMPVAPATMAAEFGVIGSDVALISDARIFSAKHRAFLRGRECHGEEVHRLQEITWIADIHNAGENDLRPVGQRYFCGIISGDVVGIDLVKRQIHILTILEPQIIGSDDEISDRNRIGIVVLVAEHENVEIASAFQSDRCLRRQR